MNLEQIASDMQALRLFLARDAAVADGYGIKNTKIRDHLESIIILLLKDQGIEGKIKIEGARTRGKMYGTMPVRFPRIMFTSVTVTNKTNSFSITTGNHPEHDVLTFIVDGDPPEQLKQVLVNLVTVTGMLILYPPRYHQ